MYGMPNMLNSKRPWILFFKTFEIVLGGLKCLFNTNDGVGHIFPDGEIVAEPVSGILAASGERASREDHGSFAEHLSNRAVNYLIFKISLMINLKILNVLYLWVAMACD